MVDKKAECAELMKNFEYAHLPPHLQEVSKPFCEIAHKLELAISANTEHAAGLRKLLEAKDCFVRACLLQINEEK